MIPTVVYREAFKHLRLKLHSEFWAIPDEVYRDALGGVREWMIAQPQGEDTVEIMHPRLQAEVFEVRKQ